MEGPKWLVLLIIIVYETLCSHWCCLGHVLYLGRASSKNETLPDFRERCRVKRHPRVSRELTDSQRTPRIWCVTPWYQILGIRIPRELGFGYPSPLGWFDVS